MVCTCIDPLAKVTITGMSQTTDRFRPSQTNTCPICRLSWAR